MDTWTLLMIATLIVLIAAGALALRTHETAAPVDPTQRPTE